MYGKGRADFVQASGKHMGKQLPDSDEEQNEQPTDEKLWRLMVESVEVDENGKLVFTLRNGMEIEV